MTKILSQNNKTIYDIIYRTYGHGVTDDSTGLYDIADFTSHTNLDVLKIRIL